MPETAAIEVVVSCEHGGNRIPALYEPLFKFYHHLLSSHRGYDPGARAFALRLAAACHTRALISTISRLLVDLNRSPGHPQRFSFITRSLGLYERQHILKTYYQPYRNNLQSRIKHAIESGRMVLHIASHSFTPVFNGRTRDVDVGLLYDPGREMEKRFCRTWRREIIRHCEPDGEWRVFSNSPYQGKSDGVPAYLRTVFPQRYIGIELELNQYWHLEQYKRWQILCADLIDSLKKTLSAFEMHV